METGVSAFIALSVCLCAYIEKYSTSFNKNINTFTLRQSVKRFFLPTQNHHILELQNSIYNISFKCTERCCCKSMLKILHAGCTTTRMPRKMSNILIEGICTCSMSVRSYWPRLCRVCARPTPRKTWKCGSFQAWPCGIGSEWLVFHLLFSLGKHKRNIWLSAYLLRVPRW